MIKETIKTILAGKLMQRFGMGRILAITVAAMLLPYVVRKISGRDIREGRIGQVLDKLDFSDYIPWLRNMKSSRAARTA